MAINITYKGNRMKLVKPIWRRGNWSYEHQYELINELMESQKFRSLTNEESYWLTLLKL